LSWCARFGINIEEIKAFFHREAAAANAEAEQLLQQEYPPIANRA
jgi:hypothetical protein